MSQTTRNPSTAKIIRRRAGDFRTRAVKCGWDACQVRCNMNEFELQPVESIQGQIVPRRCINRACAKAQKTSEKK